MRISAGMINQLNESISKYVLIIDLKISAHSHAYVHLHFSCVYVRMHMWIVADIHGLLIVPFPI